MTVSLAVLAASVTLAALALVLLARHAGRLPADAPNARSLHQRAVPRGGGLAIWAGFAPAALFAPPAVPGPWPLWLASLAAVAAVSFADDVRGLPPSVRLAVHALAAALAASLIASPALSHPLLVAAIALAIVWGSNLFNFMDGSDGLAATMAASGFAAYALAAALAGTNWVAFASLALACLAFLRANGPPAKMFMGDVGAVPLGFLAAAFGSAGVVQGWWPAWFPLLVFLPFILDATLTLGRRALRGERIWHAHRTHYYQRLNALGAGHRGTLAVYAATMLASAALALVCLGLQPAAGWVAVAAASGVLLTGCVAIDYHWARRS